MLILFHAGTQSLMYLHMALKLNEATEINTKALNYVAKDRRILTTPQDL